MSAPRLLAPTTISGGVPTAGAGTLNTIALWTPDGNTLGNSLLTQSGNIVTNASGAIRAAGTTQTSPAFTRHDTTTSGIYFPATNEIGFTISSQHAMVISSGRSVGIGTTNPGGRLDVVGVAGLSWAIRAQVNSANTLPALNAELGINLKNTSATVGNYTSITNRDSSDNANTQINFINVNNSGSGAINFVTRDSVGGSGERARIDSAGNFGIGVIPSAWASSVRAEEMRTHARWNYNSGSDSVAYWTVNAFLNSANNAIYKATAAASQYTQIGGAHVWERAVSGTAGNTVTWLESARIDSSGYVGIGLPSPSAPLHVQGPLADWSAKIQGSATSGSSYGLNMRAGTTAADTSLRLQNAAGTVEHLFVRGDGNVGIGTASPGAILHTLGAGTTTGIFATTSANAWVELRRSTSTTLGYIGTGTGLVTGGAAADLAFRCESGNLLFSTGATERARIDSNGNVGIGVTPISPLHVKGNATNTDGILTLTPNTGGRNHQVQSLQASSLFRIFDQSAGASRLEIDINGNISAATTGGTFNASTTNAGIKLPATPGNADTQTLDCYQENYASNSWTPVIFGGTTAGTATYSVQEGFYTRWGNLIFCTATVVFSGHTGTGNLSLSGLPFAAKTAGSGTYRSSIIIEEGGGVKAILRLQSGTTATTTGVSIAASGNYVITFVYATN
jgi:hypothetical protein